MIADKFPPVNSSGTTRPMYFAKHLRDYGYFPLVVAAGLTGTERLDHESLAALAGRCEIHRFRPRSLRDMLLGGRGAGPAASAKPHAAASVPVTPSLARRLRLLITRNVPRVLPIILLGMKLYVQQGFDLIWATCDPLTSLIAGYWLLRLTGRNVRRLCASTGNYFFREYQTNDMEDFGQILMEMDDGSSATIPAGRTGWRSHPATGLQRTVLVGAQETATVDAHSPRVDVWADADPWQPPERDPEDPQAMWGGPQEARFTAAPKQAWHTPPAPAGAEAGGAGDAAYFLDCIENGVSSDVSADLAAAATQILLAAYRSAATGESVDLPLD